ELLRSYAFSKYTEATITGRDDFVNELDRVRELGYAVDNQVNEPGVRCGAAPIFEHNGSIAAAISISTLVVSVDEHLFEQYIALLKK
ncbi:IclR family transcriptional regulator C-terminal domain-containing protein, partial [Lysinibacillus sp. GbtcB16]|uniref:IclR family transcriptional regulator C-terminal domain-containing protein n=1 Tax=Lysinibacillus sp. GbtcB16 TaxID=2824761 RepID=UPI001C30F7F1